MRTALSTLRQAFHGPSPTPARLSCPKTHALPPAGGDPRVPLFYLFHLFIPAMTLTSSLELQRIRIMDLEGVLGPERLH